MNKSLYIHIPFCAKKCVYCDFYSIKHDSALARSYIDVMAGQIKRLDEKPYTIYIGGGTPTSLDVAALKKLFAALGRFSADCIEFTVEANPESLSSDKIKLLLDCGVNRLSIGIQSFNDEKLKALGRIHDSSRAKDAVSMAFKNGFKNISIDLMFGVWGETIGDWQNELDMAVKMPVKHISCYSLTYETGTRLYDKVKSGAIKPLAEGSCAKMYETAAKYLQKKSFFQYEISNFAKRGFMCKHNLHYWDNNPYIGIGASAASFINGVRMKNISDIKEYITLVKNGKSVVASKEKLSTRESALETAAIKIRTKDGIDFSWFKEKTGFDFNELERKSMEPLLKERLIKCKITKGKCRGICLTKKGFLFCDSVSSQLL